GRQGTGHRHPFVPSCRRIARYISTAFLYAWVRLLTVVFCGSFVWYFSSLIAAVVLFCCCYVRLTRLTPLHHATLTLLLSAARYHSTTSTTTPLHTTPRQNQETARRVRSENR
ncbi:unnamed protein product, partial [Pylaiella littoralis]